MIRSNAAGAAPRALRRTRALRPPRELESIARILSAGARRLGGIARELAALRPLSVADRSGPNPRGLMPHQLAGARWLRDLVHALLADEMGVGKTPTLLRALPQRARGVIVCPASLVVMWLRAAGRWRPDLRAELGELRRPAAGELLVVSYDALPDALPPTGWRDVWAILDECHYAKNPEALRTARVRLLAAACGHVWGATGTPILSYASDLWGVLESLGLGPTFGSLAELERAVAEGSARARLAPVMLRRTRAEVLPHLPAKTHVTVPVAAPPDLRALLDAKRSEWPDPSELPPLALLSEAREALARSRIPAAVEYVQNAAASEPVVVFSAHVEPVETIGQLAGAAAITGAVSPRRRAELVEKFQRGELRILALTIDAGGEGWTLTAASLVVFVDLDYTPAKNWQAEDRVARIGQTRPVVVVRLVSDHPLDARMLEILDRKRQLVESVL